MWSQLYKGAYYIQGTFNKEACIALYSPTGYGYEWRKECKSLHAAKLAITKHIKEKKLCKL